jgi:hypothetical protein
MQCTLSKYFLRGWMNVVEKRAWFGTSEFCVFKIIQGAGCFTCSIPSAQSDLYCLLIRQNEREIDSSTKSKSGWIEERGSSRRVIELLRWLWSTSIHTTGSSIHFNLFYRTIQIQTLRASGFAFARRFQNRFTNYWQRVLIFPTVNRKIWGIDKLK